MYRASAVSSSMTRIVSASLKSAVSASNPAGRCLARPDLPRCDAPTPPAPSHRTAPPRRPHHRLTSTPVGPYACRPTGAAGNAPVANTACSFNAGFELVDERPPPLDMVILIARPGGEHPQTRASRHPVPPPRRASEPSPTNVCPDTAGHARKARLRRLRHAAHVSRWELAPGSGRLGRHS
jgi:hypothetical protein